MIIHMNKDEKMFCRPAPLKHASVWNIRQTLARSNIKVRYCRFKTYSIGLFLGMRAKTEPFRGHQQ